MKYNAKNFNTLKGKSGEEIACEFLNKKGYRILNKNFTTELGEIDLIITDEETLIFVEVKARGGEEYGYPAEAVNYYKRNKINQVASQYIKKYRLFNIGVRFDVVEVYLNERRVNHIENAFDSYLRY